MSTSSSSKLPPFLQISPPPVTPPSTARLKALYASTVAQRTSNPTGYAANAAWWSGVLRETLRSGWVNGTALAVSGGEDDGEGKGKGKSKGTGATQDEDGGNVWENEVGGDRVVLRVDDDLLERYEWGGSKPKGFGGFIVRSPNPMLTRTQYS
jgi:charged multivesicular body protein 7